MGIIMRFLSILIVSFILIINPTLASIVGNEDPETEIYEAKQALKKCEKKKIQMKKGQLHVSLLKRDLLRGYGDLEI